MSNTETIDQATLESLVEAGAIRSTNIVGHSGGWGVVVKYGKNERALSVKRGSLRSFRKFDTLVSFLKRLGLVQYQVDASQFDPIGIKAERTRVDASDRMKNAHGAAAYKGWLTTEVEESIADPRPSLTHEAVLQGWEKERAALLKRVGKAKTSGAQ